MKKHSKKITRKQKKFLAEFKTALKEVDLHIQGEIKLKSVDQFLREL
jgi:hypothetical protein